MNRLNNLLMASDLSAPARHALDRAALVALDSGARLSLIHVVNPSPMDKMRQAFSGLPENIEQQMLDEARYEMRNLAASMLERHNVAPGVCVQSGNLLNELISYADALPADLVVLGARGSGFMRHLLLGSTAERMLSSLPVPMLVVKQAAHESYRRVLVPVDFSRFSLVALRLVRALAPNAKIVLLHAFEVPFEGQLRYAGVEDQVIEHYRHGQLLQTREKLLSLCAAAGIPVGQAELLALHGNPTQMILEQEQESDCDLIVMGKHGESEVRDFLLGSATRHVLAESQVDVLVSL